MEGEGSVLESGLEGESRGGPSVGKGGRGRRSVVRLVLLSVGLWILLLLVRGRGVDEWDPERRGDQILPRLREEGGRGQDEVGREG